MAGDPTKEEATISAIRLTTVAPDRLAGQHGVMAETPRFRILPNLALESPPEGVHVGTHLVGPLGFCADPFPHVEVAGAGDRVTALMGQSGN